MNNLTSFFKVASGVFAVIPGLAVLLSSVGVPPNSSNTLFAAVIESLGVLTLMSLWLNRSGIRKRSEKKITQVAIKGILIFVFSLFCYLFLYGYLIEDVPNSSPIFFPLWAQGDLAIFLERYGSKTELIRQFGRDDVVKLIHAESNNSLLITTLVLLLFYQFVFVSLTFSFGILAIRSIHEVKEAPIPEQRTVNTEPSPANSP